MERLRAVVFDVGKVLFDWDPALVYADEPPATVARFLDETGAFAWHEQHDIGRPFAETSAELAARYPHHAALIARWGPEFSRGLTPIAGMAEIVAALDAAGVPLYAITNFSAEFFGIFRREQAALFDRFAGIVVSGEERLVKPDPAIYALALGRFGLAAGEALFVDDRPENVAAAQAAGLIGHVFRDAPTLADELAHLGLA